MSAGDPVVVLYRDVQDRTVILLTKVLPSRDHWPSISFRVANEYAHHGPWRYFYNQEGLTWCRANIDAVRALDAAVALGLEAPDEPF